MTKLCNNASVCGMTTFYCCPWHDVHNGNKAM